MANDNSKKEEIKKAPVEKWGDSEHDTQVHKNLRPQKSTPTCAPDGTYVKIS